MVCPDRLDSCCCCVSLRKGVLIIGYLEMVINVSMVTALFYALAQFAHAEKNEDTKAEHLMLIGLMVVYIFSTLNMLFAIVGAHTGEPTLLYIHFNVSMIQLIASVTLIITILMIHASNNSQVLNNSHFLVEFGAIRVWRIYHLVVIRSAYLEMHEMGNEGHPINQPQVPYRSI